MQRKPRTAAPARNGRRRNTGTALVRTGAPAASLARNPRKRRRNPQIVPRTRNRRRQRNPQVKGLVMGALYAGAGAAATNLVSGFIPIGGGGWMDVIKQGVAAYLVGFLAERFTSPANAQLMAIGGFAGAAWSAVNMALSGATGFLSGGGHAATVQGPQAGGGGVGYIGDIVPHPGLYDMTGMGDVVPAPAFYPSDPQGY